MTISCASMEATFTFKMMKNTKAGIILLLFVIMIHTIFAMNLILIRPAMMVTRTVICDAMSTTANCEN